MNPNDAASSSSNCSYALDNGQRCHAPALRGDLFCRHHTPEACARRRRIAESASETDTSTAQSRPDEPSADPNATSPWDLRAYWRMHHRLIPTFQPEQLDDAFNMILSALSSRHIGPRSAGRLFLAILDRRRELLRQAQEAAIRDLLHLSREVRAGAGASLPDLKQLTALCQDLGNYPVSVDDPEIPRISMFNALEN